MTDERIEYGEADEGAWADELVVFPMSYGQQRLWFLDQFQPDSPFYNIPSAIKLTGVLDVDALRAALNGIVARHEALRTTFATVNGEPVQVIAPSLSIHAPLIDLCGLPTEERTAESQRLAREEARTPFNLTKGPLLRAKLIRLAEDEHLALVTMHHIVSDGWSMGVFVRELAILYHAFSQGRSSPLPPLPIQYADYAEWQREWLQGEVLDRQIGYWKKQLGDPPAPVLELPGDRPRPAVQTANGASLEAVYPRKLVDQLYALTRQEGATLFMTLLAGFDVLLHRYTSLTDICVGSPIANRRQAELEGLIGLFINTQVYRTDLAPREGATPTFREILRRVKQIALDAYEYQDVPFEMLVDALEVERDMSHSSLFQVMFILQNAGMSVEELPGLKLSTLDVDAGTSTFDLTLNISEQADGLSASVEYNTDIFDASSMERLLGHFRRLLEAAVANPDTSIAILPLLTQDERRRMLIEWNATDVDFGGFRPVFELILERAEAVPGIVAAVAPRPGTGEPLRFEQWESITYGELIGRANRMARRLHRMGTGPGSLVAISADKSVDMLAGLLAIWNAGAAYLPIDPAYPADRIRHMLSDSGAALLLTQEHLLARLQAAAGEDAPHTVTLEALVENAQHESGAPLPYATAPDSLAYVIYTSGSTGQSKGVMISHASLANAYYAWERAYDLVSPVKAHLQMASFSFDVFSGDLVRGLCSGGKLVLTPRDLLLQPEALYELMRREGVTCAEFVPGVLRPLVQYLEDTRQSLDFMQVLACGSDSWYVGEYRRFLRQCGSDTRLINSFGLTEATIDTCYFEWRRDDLMQADALALDQIVPIGKPFANQQMYILDGGGQPAPIGVPGELYIGGAGIALGYLNRPDLTAERFVSNPFDTRASGRLYRTGDLARYLPDGNVQFLGRADSQVKIRGYRIEPGEIEAAIDRHGAVTACAVVARPDPKGQNRLVAYYVPKTGSADLSTTDLRRFLQDRLPDYMVPSLFVAVPRLQLTPNGKVDRNALPKPDWSERVLEETFVAPRTDTEKRIAEIWREVLGIDEVGAYDNFFELGGHSLLATQAVSRLRAAFSIELPLRELFESPTVATLAEQIDALVGGPAVAAALNAPPIVPLGREYGERGEFAVPLSFAQQRLWFLDQLEPDSPFYNIPEAVRLRGPLDVEALQAALRAIVARHESLRTSFAATDGVPRQIVAPSLTLDVPLDDLSHLPTEARERELLRLATQEAQTPFDLARAPLLRARLVRLGPDDHALLATMHHIISDNWSSQVLIRELTILYEGLRRGHPRPLPPLPVQYADFAAWQRSWLEETVELDGRTPLQRQLDYWRENLAGAAPVLALPTDRPRPPVQTFHGDFQSFEVSPTVSSGLQELSRREGVTPFMTLLAAFQTLLSRYSGQDDILVGSPIANRTQAELEGIIGFFVNTLVLRSDTSGDPTFREFLKRVRATALGAYANQDVPFETLVDAVRPHRDLSHSPLFQVMFVLQSGQAGLPAWGGETRVALSLDDGLTLSSIDAHSGTAKFDLTLFMVQGDTSFGGAVEYNTDLFDHATMARLIEHFRLLLGGIVADPQRPLSALPLLAPGEERYLLHEWNRTEAEFPDRLLAHELIEAQVDGQPGALAVRFGPEGDEQTLTYAELDARANQLAHYLRKRGIGPDVLAALSLERSLELAVAILGVLKAGGAYVPLDPSYPAERLSYMIADSGATVLLTQAHLLPRLAGAGLPDVLLLDAEWDRVALEPAERVPRLGHGANLAYAIYTSGSTGRPKGTLIHHRGLVNYLAWCRRAYPLHQGSGAPVHSSISFDLTVTSLLAPLVAGRQVHLLSPGLAVETLTPALQKGGYSLVKITPAHLQLTGQQLDPAQASGATHAFVIGGENLLSEHISFWRKYAPRTALVNEYGPTETVVGCCVYTAPPDAELTGSIPIGRPIINTQLYVLDRHLRPVPQGVAGELYIAGAGIARGYHNRPDLTAERFLPDPFGAPGGRMYRTGDLVRLRSDDNLEYLGRMDEQVKIRGFRVELGEIESVLAEHPGLAEVCVTVFMPGGPGDKRLVAYFAPAHDQAVPGAADLRAFLAARLPDYMLPAVFVALDVLPLTPNGKVDRKRLPAPDEGGTLEGGAAYVAPADEVEHILAEIWQRLLRVQRVGRDDSFFELGGDSILSIQMIARAAQAGITITPKQIFQAPTISELVPLLALSPEQRIVAEQGPVLGPVPLTPIQRWFLEGESTDLHHWNQSLLLTVDQPLDAQVLQTAVAALLEHHDALRLRIERDDAGWQQAFTAPGGTPPLEWVDLAVLDDDEFARAVEVRAGQVQASLDLSAGPIMRVVYFAGGQDRAGRLLLVVHHLAVDGVSWGILLEDLQTAYVQAAKGQPVKLPLKTTSFRRWAERLERYAAEPAALKELDRWLAQAEPVPLPKDYPGGENTIASADSIAIALSSEDTEALVRDLPAHRIHPVDVLAAAWVRTLASWSGNGTHTVDMEGHGREDLFASVNTTRTVGWFTALYPVCFDMTGIDSAQAAVQACHDQLQSIPNGGVGYGILRYLGRDEESARLAQFGAPETSLNYLGRMDSAIPGTSPFGLAPEARGAERSLQGRRRYLLELDGGVIGGQLRMELTYSRALHRQTTAEWLAAEFERELRAAISACLAEPGAAAASFEDFGWEAGDLSDILGEIDRSLGSAS